ncbi:hypothetical protein MED222_05700 [Vibrio sp. MED222]|nr:hypothetical protein MED222_05700 [Vibrio sp. MED222]
MCRQVEVGQVLLHRLLERQSEAARLRIHI